MATEKTLDYVIAYLAAGGATLAWSTERAATGKLVWPGFGAKAPGPMVGALETVIFWPVAVLHNMQNPGPEPEQKPDGG